MKQRSAAACRKGGCVFDGPGAPSQAATSDPTSSTTPDRISLPARPVAPASLAHQIHRPFPPAIRFTTDEYRSQHRHAPTAGRRPPRLIVAARADLPSSPIAGKPTWARFQNHPLPPTPTQRPVIANPKPAASAAERSAAVNSIPFQPNPLPPTTMDPEISRFYGIVIRMPAPEGNTLGRFEAHYGPTSIVVGLNPLRILRSSAPARVRGMVLEWAARQRLELLMAWRQRGSGAVPASIPPLV